MYDTDLVAWTVAQTKILRSGKYPELDVEHLIEELEGLGGSERSALESRLEVLFSHLIKAQMFPTSDARRGWQVTILEQSKRINRILRNSPSLHNYFQSIAPEIFDDAKKITALAMDFDPQTIIGSFDDYFVMMMDELNSQRK